MRKWDAAPEDENPQRPERKGVGAKNAGSRLEGTSLEERSAGVSGWGWRNSPESGSRRTHKAP